MQQSPYNLWVKVKCGRLYKDRALTGQSARMIAEENGIRDKSSVAQWGHSLDKLEWQYEEKYGEPWQPRFDPETVTDKYTGQNAESETKDLMLAGEITLAKENQELREENEDLKYLNKLLMREARSK